MVDDNADAADTLGQILSLEGFDVRVYNDAAQTLGAARDFKGRSFTCPASQEPHALVVVAIA